MLKEYKLTVLDYEPVYSEKSKEGHFLVSIQEYGNEYNLSFIPILAFIIKNDEQLMQYVEKAFDLSDPKTKISDIIRDLVEIGIPMEKHIQQYFDYVVNSMSRELKALTMLMSFFMPDQNYGDYESED